MFVGAITDQNFIWLPETPWLGCGHAIFRVIEERTCGNLGGQLKKKWDFQECSRKTHVHFLWILVFDFGSSKGCNTILLNFQGCKLIFSGISKDKVTNLKFRQWFPNIDPCLPRNCMLFMVLCYANWKKMSLCIWLFAKFSIYMTGIFMRF